MHRHFPSLDDNCTLGCNLLLPFHALSLDRTLSHPTETRDEVAVLNYVSIPDRYVTSLAARIEPVVSSPHPPQAPALLCIRIPPRSPRPVSLLPPFAWRLHFGNASQRLCSIALIFYRTLQTASPAPGIFLRRHRIPSILLYDRPIHTTALRIFICSNGGFQPHLVFPDRRKLPRHRDTVPSPKASSIPSQLETSPLRYTRTNCSGPTCPAITVQ